MAHRPICSNFGTIAGVNPYCTPRSLWEYATGRVGGGDERWEGNDHTRRGNALEDTARDFYTAKLGTEVMRTGLFIHKAHAWLAASPDGLVGDNGVLEIKCPAHGPHETVPPNYMAQLQGQLHCSGRETAHFLSYAQGQGKATLFECAHAASHLPSFCGSGRLQFGGTGLSIRP